MQEKRAKTGGRTKGTPNKNTLGLRELARTYTTDALKVLVDIALYGEAESARVSAANSLLDRGYGKPSTVLTGDEEGGAVRVAQVIELIGVQAGK